MRMKIKILIFILIGFLTFFSSLKLYTKYENAHFICSHPKYKLIVNGIGKIEVVNIIGIPDKKIIKSKLSDHVFGCGKFESRVKEGWIYSFFGWGGKIEIYFNEKGMVIGKNCGDC